MVARGKRVVARLLLATVPTVLLLVAAEFVFRRYQPVVDPRAWQTHPRGEWAACYRKSLTLGYEPVPGRCGFNDLGMAAEHPRQKTRRTFRVLLLGDSLSERQRWVDLARLELAARAPGRQVEIWNSGVTGYDTCAELRVLQEKGWSTNPDLVLVQLCVNDFFQTSSILPLAHGRVSFHVGHRSMELPGWVLTSHLLTWLAIHVGLPDEGRADGRAGTASVERCLARMQQEAAARHTPLALLVFPVLRSDGDGAATAAETTYLKLEREAGAICQRLRLPCFKLRPGLQRAGSLSGLRQRPDDLWHIRAQAQDAVGRLVADHVWRRFLSPGSQED